MIKTILDTDIGSDVDDAMALCFALQSPEIDLKGITTVYGDVELRAKIALKLISIAGKAGIPVAAGIGQTLLRERDILVMGHEGRGLITKSDVRLQPIEKHAVDFLIQRVKEEPSEITIIAIGPLTNIAGAIIKEPKIVEYVKELIFIGGIARLADNALDVPACEWNVRADPEAARLVFSSGIPLTMLGMDVTRTEATRLHTQHLEQLRQAGNPLAGTAARLLEIYWECAKPELRCIHDVVAVAYAIDRSMVETRKLRVDVETRGIHTTGFTLVTVDEENANAEVGLHIAEDRFLKLFMDRMCSI